MKIYYLTSNAQKFEEAQHVLTGWSLERIDMDLVEIQGSREAVITAKACEALAKVNAPLIVEDVSVSCPALQGLPGPYVKDFLRQLGEEGFYQLIHKYDDHRVMVICSAAYIEPGLVPQVFEGEMQGSIVSPKGHVRHGKLSWNAIVQPIGETRTFGEMSIFEHSQISMRRKALLQLKHFLENR